MGLVTGSLVLAALVGTLLRTHRTWWLAPGWHPVLVLSAWSLVILLGGLAGSLRAGVVLVISVGLAAGVNEVVRHRRQAWAALREPALLTFAVTGVLLAVGLHGRLFTHYDNFSHWALVVRVMLETGALPSPDTPAVRFTTYPLGASSLAYLFSRMFGGTESAAMLGHDLWVASTALPLVTAARRRTLPGIGLYVVATLMLLTMITTPTSLLVDALVAGLAACLFVLVLLHRRELLARPWPFAVLASALLMVKTSGALFVAIAGLVLLGGAVSGWFGRVVKVRPLLAVLTAVAAPWLVLWLWSSHVARTFPDAGSAKHSVSATRFAATLAQKSPEDIRAIVSALSRAVLTDSAMLVACATVVVAGAFAMRSGVLGGRTYASILAVLAFTIVAWDISLLLTYLLSMPLDEALGLAGFRRYEGTIRLLVLLVGLALVSRWITQSDRWTPRSVVALVVVLLLPAGLVLSAVRTLAALPAQGHYRAEVSAAVASANPPIAPDERVCLLHPAPTRTSYLAWMATYLTLNGTVRGWAVPDRATSLPDAPACDVLLLLDGRPHVADLVRRAGFDLPTDATLPTAVRR